MQKLCGIELGIKWVNDLYYQGKKVCGILTEAGTSVESGLPLSGSLTLPDREIWPGAPDSAGRLHSSFTVHLFPGRMPLSSRVEMRASA